jgi:hypothetical protein
MRPLTVDIVQISILTRMQQMSQTLRECENVFTYTTELENSHTQS